MPLYQYRTKDGELVERLVPVDERDNQEGLERIISFNGLVWSPHSANGFA